jgi:hypothetical protein
MKLYQINLTRADCDRANRGEVFPKLTAYRDASMLGEFPGREFYSHVADLATADLDHAFEIGNVGPESKITRHAPMHSISVGDVLVPTEAHAEAGIGFIVQSVGFAPVEFRA